MVGFDFEFSRPLDVSTITGREQTRTLRATDLECAALARRFSLLTLESLSAVVKVRRRSSGVVEATGRLSARLVQACVVTLEPVQSDIETQFARLYSSQVRDEPSQIDLDLERDEPDLIENGQIDLGELVAEELALALDPYPHAPGASSCVPGSGPEGA